MDFYSFKKVLNVGEYQLEGFSRGSFKTGLILLPFKICLDAGVCNQYEPNMVLVTHGHTDHVGELYQILIGNSRKFRVPVVSSPMLIKSISNYLNCLMSMNRGKNTPYTKWQPCGMEPKTKKRFEIQCKTIELETFTMDHSVDSIGFGISEIREKLKPEYEGLPQQDIIEFKKTTKITYEKEFPIALFCGDTSSDILPTLPFERFPIVIIEASFLDDNHKQEAFEKKHMHISSLEKYFTLHSQTTFVLIHFSSRYTKEMIQNYQVIYEDNFNNVKFFV